MKRIIGAEKSKRRVFSNIALHKYTILNFVFQTCQMLPDSVIISTQYIQWHNVQQIHRSTKRLISKCAIYTAYFSPVIVNVLPAPVCPYANKVLLKPSNVFFTNCEAHFL